MALDAPPTFFKFFFAGFVGFPFLIPFDDWSLFFLMLVRLGFRF